MDEREFVTYRGDHIPHPKAQQRYTRELTKDVPEDAGPDDIAPEMYAAISEYHDRIHAAIDARVAADMMADPDPAWRCEGLDAARRLEDAGLSEPELWKWFFEAVLHTAVPDDLEAYATRHDFKGIDGLRRAVLRELIYIRKLDRMECRAVPIGVQNG